MIDKTSMNIVANVMSNYVVEVDFYKGVEILNNDFLL